MRTVIAILMCFGALSVSAQESQPNNSGEGHESKTDDSNDKKWSFEIAPYLWLAGVDSEIEIGPVEGESEADFGDVLDVLEGGFMLHVEARRERFGLFADIMHLELEDDADKGPLNLELKLEMTMYEAGAFYRFGSEKRSVDLLAGLRGFEIDTELELTPGPDSSKDRSWVDPIVGARVMGDIGEKWAYSLRGDVGGFGVGSDITWNAIGLFRRDLTKRTELGLGYRYLFIDYDTSRIEFQQTFHGPIAGISIRF